MFNKVLILNILLFASHASATGLPVFDSLEFQNQIQDSIYTISAIENLLTEFNVSQSEMKSLLALEKDLKNLRDEINMLQDFYDETDSLVEMRISRGQILADYINNITRYIRKFKRVLSMAAALSNRPGAINSALNMWREERERIKAQYEAAMRAQEEREKVEQLRRKIVSRAETKKAIAHEYSYISQKNSSSFISSPEIKEKANKGKNTLW